MKLAFTALLLIAGTAAADQPDIYRWTDSEGVTHYSDRTFASQEARRVTLKPLDVVSARLVIGMPGVQPLTDETARSETVIEAADMAALEIVDASSAEPVASPASHHEITLYSWTDEKGVRHYGNQNPAGQPAAQVDLGTH